MLGPILAGMLFEDGQSLATVAFVMALGSLVAAVMILLQREKIQARAEAV